MPIAHAPSQDRIGFTAPTIIYDKMRAIEALRKELGRKITTFAGDPTFVAAWRGWEERWDPFFRRYQTPGLAGDPGRLGALFFTDDLDAQVEEFRDQINAFHADYLRQRQANGQPVPQPATPSLPRPTPHPNPPAPGMPWWFWMLTGLGLAGGGYLVYRYYVRAQALKAGIREEVLPLVLPGGLGASVARAARDVPRLPSPEPPPRALATPRFPRTLADFANDPRAGRSAAYLYRPYDHPHLVPAPALASPHPGPRRAAPQTEPFEDHADDDRGDEHGGHEGEPW